MEQAIALLCRYAGPYLILQQKIFLNDIMKSQLITLQTLCLLFGRVCGWNDSSRFLYSTSVLLAISTRLFCEKRWHRWEL